jgi:hypothetical protein
MLDHGHIFSAPAGEQRWPREGSPYEQLSAELDRLNFTEVQAE